MEKHASGVKKVEAQNQEQRQSHRTGSESPPNLLGRGVPRPRLGVLGGVLPRGLALEAPVCSLAVEFQSCSRISRPLAFRAGAGQNSLDLLLRPLEVLSDLPCVAHTVLEALARLREAGLRLLLQVHELAVLGVHLSRPAALVSFSSVKLQFRYFSVFENGGMPKRKKKKKKRELWTGRKLTLAPGGPCSCPAEAG